MGLECELCDVPVQKMETYDFGVASSRTRLEYIFLVACPACRKRFEKYMETHPEKHQMQEKKLNKKAILQRLEQIRNLDEINWLIRSIKEGDYDAF